MKILFTYPRTLPKSKQNKHKLIHKNTHHSKNAKSQKQGEIWKVAKEK